MLDVITSKSNNPKLFFSSESAKERGRKRKRERERERESDKSLFITHFGTSPQMLRYLTIIIIKQKCVNEKLRCIEYKQDKNKRKLNKSNKQI